LLLRRDHEPGLKAGDDSLEGVVEVELRDRLVSLAARENRGLVAEVCEVGAGQPGGPAGDEVEVDFLDRLVARVHPENLLAAPQVGKTDEDLAVETAGPQERLVETVDPVRGGDHDQVATVLETVHLDEQLVERLVLLA